MADFGLVGVAVALTLACPSYFARMAKRLARRAASTSSIGGGVVGRSSSISASGARTGNGAAWAGTEGEGEGEGGLRDGERVLRRGGGGGGGDIL